MVAIISIQKMKTVCTVVCLFVSGSIRAAEPIEILGEQLVSICGIQDPIWKKTLDTGLDSPGTISFWSPTVTVRVYQIRMEFSSKTRDDFVILDERGAVRFYQRVSRWFHWEGPSAVPIRRYGLIRALVANADFQRKLVGYQIKESKLTLVEEDDPKLKQQLQMLVQLITKATKADTPQVNVEDLVLGVGLLDQKPAPQTPKSGK